MEFRKKNKAKNTQKKHFFQRKGFLWTVGILVGLILVIAIAFRVSPFPGALLIRAVFEHNQTETVEAMAKYAPPIPVMAVTDQQYREGDNDAHLDVYFPSSVVNTDTMLPTIIWTHGGAWVSGGKDNIAPYAKLLAAEGFTVVSMDYSLAPEHQYPTPVHQLNDAYGYLKDNATRFHIDPNKFVLAGDSAGAQLSSQMAAIITNPEYAQRVGITPKMQPSQLKGVILNCGIYQMRGLTQPDPTLPKLIGWGDDVSVWAYSGTKDFDDPVLEEMSAHFHVTKDFPATYISGGNADPLTKAQAVPFADKLESLGVDVTRHFFPDAHQPALPHEYQFNLDNADGQDALQRTIMFAQEVTAR